MKTLINQATEKLKKKFDYASKYIWVEHSERSRGGFFNSFEEGAETDDKAIYLRKFTDLDEYAGFFGFEDFCGLKDIEVAWEDEVVKEIEGKGECLTVVEDYNEIDEEKFLLMHSERKITSLIPPYLYYDYDLKLNYMSYKFRMCGNIYDVYRHFEEALMQDSAMPVKIYKKEHALLQLKNAPRMQESKYLAKIILKNI